MNTQTTFSQIPKDVRLLIFNELDGISLGRCQRVCKQFKEDIDRCQNLWRNAFAREHAGYLPPAPLKGWRAHYIEQNIVTRNIASGNFGSPVRFEGCNHNVENGFTYGDKLYVRGDHKLNCFSLSTGKLLKTIAVLPDTSPYTLRAHFVHEGSETSYFIYQTSSQISIWDTSQDICVFTKDRVMGITIQAKGTKVVFYTKEGRLQVWDFKSNRLIHQIDGEPLNHTILLGRGKLIGNMLFVWLSDNRVLTYDIEKEQQIYTIEREKADHAQLFPTDKHLSDIYRTGGKSQANIYESASGRLIHTIQLWFPYNSADKFFPAEISQNQLIGISPNDKRTVTCWDLETGEITKQFTPPSGTVYFFKVGPPNRLVITTTEPADENIGITIWNLEDGALLNHKQYKGDPNFTYNGTQVKIQGHIMYFGKWPSDKFHFWDLTTATEIGTFSVGHNYYHARLWHFDGARFFVDAGTRQPLIYPLNQLPAP